MSRFRKLTHALWHCQYHIVWVPKYRYRVLDGDLAQEVRTCLLIFSEQSHCEVVEMNIQKDHVHLIIMVPPKVSISELMGRFKGRTAIRVLNRFKELRKKRYWGNHLWAPEYCVDTVGMDAEMIRRYVR
jgi:putative transposase